MEQQFQNSSTVDYSLKDGETLVLQLKNVSLFIYLFILLSPWRETHGNVRAWDQLLFLFPFFVVCFSGGRCPWGYRPGCPTQRQPCLVLMGRCHLCHQGGHWIKASYIDSRSPVSYSYREVDLQQKSFSWISPTWSFFFGTLFCNWQKPDGHVKSKSIEQGVNNVSLANTTKPKEPLLPIKPPPPPPTTLSPTSNSPRTPTSPTLSPHKNVEDERENFREEKSEPDSSSKDNRSSEDIADDDFWGFSGSWLICYHYVNLCW